VGRRRGRKEKGRKRVDVYRQLRKREGRVRRHSRRDPQGRSRSERRVQAGDHNLFFVRLLRAAQKQQAGETKRASRVHWKVAVGMKATEGEKERGGSTEKAGREGILLVRRDGRRVKGT